MERSIPDSELAEQLQLREVIAVSLAHPLPHRQFYPEVASSSHHLHHAPPPQPRQRLEKCQICLARKSPRKMLPACDCSHKFCTSCLASHADSKLRERQIPLCPHPGCVNMLAPEQCKLFLSSESYEKLTSILAEARIPEPHKVHCPFPDCSELLDGGLLDDSQLDVECLRCHRLFCVKCRVPWHASISCAEYQRLPPGDREAADIQLHNLAKEQKWRSCEICRRIIALSHGCYHMTCKCGNQFCYRCGAKWKTCKCKLWDERNLARARRRRHR